MEDLKPIKRSLVRLMDKVHDNDMSWWFGGDRELFREQLKACKSHFEVYKIGIDLNRYLMDEFFESSEWDEAKAMAERWVIRWKIA